MKKILFSLCASLLLCGFVYGLVYADSSWTYENVQILGPTMGSAGVTPPVEIVKIDVGSEDNIAAGDVMVWDLSNALTDGSGLGLTVRRCDVNAASDDPDGDIGQSTMFAGVMVTTASDDSDDGGVGYMAIRGFVDAKIDITNAKWIGRPLVLMGNNLVASFGTVDRDRTARSQSYDLSQDIGTLLERPSADGVAKVWLR